MSLQTCFITKKELSNDDLLIFGSIRPQLAALIKNDFPTINDKNYISHEALNTYRTKYLEDLIGKENKELSKLDKDVVDAMDANLLLSQKIETDKEASLTIGQKLADKIASFGGSWTFIIFFFSFIVIWITLNIWVLLWQPFDPFPFILLNLILSCLAAIQAPIIMMSQNRQEEKDRSRSEYDYKINLKAELEIRLLHEKIDHLIVHQNKRLLDIQQLQLDYLDELTIKLSNK